MLTIIHGDDIAASRTHFLQLKEKYPDATTREGQQVNLTDLSQILEGGSLFTEETTLFLENFITKKKNTADYKDIITYLNTQGKSATIIIWEGKELEKSSLTPFKQSTARVFKLPQALFMFLEAIRPNNGPQLIKLFHQTLETMEVEAIFAMLIRQFRLLLALSEKHSDIDEIKRMQDWQKTRLLSQAKLFSSEQLISSFCQLFVMEHGIKTGRLPSDLTTAIDILLVDI